MMKLVYLLMGLPGTGKTTYSKNNLKGKTISIDDVRKELSDQKVIGNTYNSQDNDKVFKEFLNNIHKALTLEDVVIVDSTNATKSERQNVYDIVSEFKPKIVVLRFLDSKNVCQKRIENRQKDVDIHNPPIHYFKEPAEALDIIDNRIKENEVSLDEPIHEIWYIKNNKIKSKKQKILIASTNEGKINIYKDVFDVLGIKTTSLKEIHLDLKVEETGNNEAENAILKAKAYHEATGLPVLANDSGLVIDRFKPEDQPGVLVRRFHGKELSDQELLNLYIEKLNEVGGESKGHYNVALALINSKGRLKVKEFKPERYFVSKPSPIIKKGVPLDSLAFDKVSGKYASEMEVRERNEFEKEEMRKQYQFCKKFFK